MTEGLYQWVENIAFYMVLMTAALHLIPGDGYRKYLKFFYRTFIDLACDQSAAKGCRNGKNF